MKSVSLTTATKVYKKRIIALPIFKNLGVDWVLGHHQIYEVKSSDAWVRVFRTEDDSS